MDYLKWGVRGGLARAIALLSIGLMTVGCTVVTAGNAQRGPRPTPRSLTGQAIAQVLLDGRTLSRILQQPFMIDGRLPPRFGGPETLQETGSGPPAECLGVAEMLHRAVYRSSKVGDVAIETWRHATPGTKVTSVKEGVVTLPTAADAEALFAKFSEQWQRCDGQVLLLPDGLLRLRAKITNVRVAPAVLAGNIGIEFDSAGPDSPSIPAGRALGVRGNCLVEAEVDFFNSSSRSLQGPGDINAIPVNIVETMMDKVSELS